MVKIKFETGQVVNFDGTPTQSDIDEVAAKIGISAVNKTQKPVSGRTLLDSGKQANVGEKIRNTLADVAGVRGFGETLGGVLAQPMIRKKAEEVNKQGADIQLELAKRIREVEAQGGDASRLRALVDTSIIDPAQVNPVLQKTNKQVLGEAIEFGAGTVGAIAGGGGLSQAGQAIMQKSAPALAKAAGSQALRSAAEGAVGGFGVGLQDQDANIGKAIGTGVIGGVAGGVLGSGAIGRGARALGRAGTALGEGVLGLTTGVGDNAIREALNIAQKGGATKEAFTNALRGKVGERELVQSIDNAVGGVIQKRNDEIGKIIENIDAGKQVNIQPIKDEVDNILNEFQIGRNADGSLDFSRNLSIANEDDMIAVTNLINRIDNFGTQAGDNTLGSVNRLRMQLQGTFGKQGIIPNMNNRIRRAARDVIGKESKELDTALRNYSEATQFIEEIQKELSVGGNPATAFKKLTSSLKNNQEIRAQLVRDLDEMTGGVLLANVTGQQLSEALSRGIIGSFAAPVVGSTAVAAGISPVFLLGLLTMSPRLVGETINALGLPLRARNALKKSINDVADAIGRENISGVIQRGEQGALRETLRNRKNIQDSRRAVNGF